MVEQDSQPDWERKGIKKVLTYRKHRVSKGYFLVSAHGKRATQFNIFCSSAQENVVYIFRSSDLASFTCAQTNIDSISMLKLRLALHRATTVGVYI